MQLANVVKSELYKNFCRKSTYILLIPVLLSFLITLGFRTGTVSLSMIGNSSKNTFLHGLPVYELDGSVLLRHHRTASPTLLCPSVFR